MLYSRVCRTHEPLHQRGCALCRNGWNWLEPAVSGAEQPRLPLTKATAAPGRLRPMHSSAGRAGIQHDLGSYLSVPWSGEISATSPFPTVLFTVAEMVTGKRREPGEDGGVPEVQEGAVCPLRKDCSKGDIFQSSLWAQIQIILFAKAESLKRKEERVPVFSNRFYSEASMERWRMLFQ